MILSANLRKNFPRLAQFLTHEVSRLKWNKPHVWHPFLKYSELLDEQAVEVLATCSNPTVEVTHIPGANGLFSPSRGTNTVFLAKAICDRFEVDHLDSRAQLLIESTILHELVHWGEFKDGKDQPDEEGKYFEVEAYGRDVGRYW